MIPQFEINDYGPLQSMQILHNAVERTGFNALNVLDDKILSLGTDADACFKLVAAGLAANTRDAAPYALVGTPVSQALAANSLIISNVTADGDIAMYANLAGNSQQFLFYDTSASVLYLSENVASHGVVIPKLLTVGTTTLDTTYTIYSPGTNNRIGGFVLTTTPTIYTYTSNSATFGINIPVSGTDSTTHNINLQLDSNTYFTVQATGDGAGGVTNPCIALGTGTTSTLANVVHDFPAKTYATAANFSRLLINNTNAITVNTSTVPVLASVYLNEPNITIGTGAVTTAATLYIAGAPTEGGSNYAAYINGSTYVAGTLQMTNGVLTALVNGAYLKAYDADDAYFIFKARDNTVAAVEVARLAGAADPYFSTGGSQQNKFYNSGIVEIGSATRNTFGIQATIDTDHTWSGIVVTATAGTNLTIGQICYQGSDGKMELADADATTTMPALYMATGTINENATGVFLVYGYLRDDSWTWATVGGLLYADTVTAGGMTQTAPSGTGDQVQVVGHAYSADIVAFMPSPVLVEVA